MYEPSCFPIPTCPRPSLFPVHTDSFSPSPLFLPLHRGKHFLLSPRAGSLLDRAMCIGPIQVRMDYRQPILKLEHVPCWESVHACFTISQTCRLLSELHRDFWAPLLGGSFALRAGPLQRSPWQSPLLGWFPHSQRFFIQCVLCGFATCFFKENWINTKWWRGLQKLQVNEVTGGEEEVPS